MLCLTTHIPSGFLNYPCIDVLKKKISAFESNELFKKKDLTIKAVLFGWTLTRLPIRLISTNDFSYNLSSFMCHVTADTNNVTSTQEYVIWLLKREQKNFILPCNLFEVELSSRFSAFWFVPILFPHMNFVGCFLIIEWWFQWIHYHFLMKNRQYRCWHWWHNPYPISWTAVSKCT